MKLMAIFNKEKWTTIRDSREIVLKHLLAKKFKNKATARNWEIKLNRNINKKDDAKTNWGEYDTARFLAKLLNENKKPNDAFLVAKDFIGGKNFIKVIGESLDGGKVLMYPEKRKFKIEVAIANPECVGIIHKGRTLPNAIRLYKNSNKVSYEADGKLSFVKCKKSKVVYMGWLEPNGDGSYNVVSYCILTGKLHGAVVSNITPDWSARIEDATTNYKVVKK